MYADAQKILTRTYRNIWNYIIRDLAAYKMKGNTVFCRLMNTYQNVCIQ